MLKKMFACLTALVAVVAFSACVEACPAKDCCCKTRVRVKTVKCCEEKPTCCAVKTCEVKTCEVKCCECKEKCCKTRVRCRHRVVRRECRVESTCCATAVSATATPATPATVEPVVEPTPIPAPAPLTRQQLVLHIEYAVVEFRQKPVRNRWLLLFFETPT